MCENWRVQINDTAPAFIRDLSGFRRATEMLRRLINGGPLPVEIVAEFAGYGFQLCVTRAHIFYARELEQAAVAVSAIFSPEVVARWRSLNELLLLKYDPSAQVSRRLQFDAPGNAAAVGFPLLEEITRLITRAWSEDGRLLRPVDTSEGLLAGPPGKRRPAKYNQGQRIVGLEHKLELMKGCLHPALRQTITNLDDRLNVSIVKGAPPPNVTLFERLAALRNGRAHGQRAQGHEAWLLTLFIAMLYYWIPQSDEDRRLVALWTSAGADGSLPYIEAR